MRKNVPSMTASVIQESSKPNAWKRYPVCPRCGTPIPTGYYNAPDMVTCPACHAPIKVDVFPVAFNGPPPKKAGETLVEGQASCFYHPQKKALIPCDHCGRFLCSLCDLEMGNKHLCPTCIEIGKKKGKIINLDRYRVLYDSTALKIALFSLILFWLNIAAAPVALYIAIRHWNSPMGIVRKSKIRFVFAIVLSILEILVWTTGLIYLITRR
jgi:hypothetical protein